MAKKGVDGNVVQALGYAAVFVGAFWALSYFTSGRGKNNSPFVPDAIENRLDDVVEALNKMFGHHWVNLALNHLQSQLALAVPGAAAVVNAVHWAERTYWGQSGAIKKQAALSALGA
jgi:hypothetical protein